MSKPGPLSDLTIRNRTLIYTLLGAALLWGGGRLDDLFDDYWGRTWGKDHVTALEVERREAAARDTMEKKVSWLVSKRIQQEDAEPFRAAERSRYQEKVDSIAAKVERIELVTAHIEPLLRSMNKHLKYQAEDRRKGVAQAQTLGDALARVDSSVSALHREGWARY